MGDLRQKAELVIRINGEDHILPLQDAISKKMDQIAGKTRETGAATDGWSKSLLTGGERLAVFTSGLQAAMAIAGRVASAIASIPAQIEEAGVDAALTAQFERAFGAAAEGIRSMLTEATAGQLDTSALEQYAARAQRMGLSVAQTAQTLELGVKAANATGRANAETIEALLASLTKGNERAAQSLGINLDLEAAYEAQARQLGVQASDLTEAQRQAVMLRETSAALAKNFGDVQISGTTIASARQLTAQLKDLDDKWNALKAAGFLWAGTALGVVQETPQAALLTLQDEVRSLWKEMDLADRGSTAWDANLAKLEARLRGNALAQGVLTAAIQQEAEAQIKAEWASASAEQVAEKLEYRIQSLRDAYGLTRIQTDEAAIAHNAAAEAKDAEQRATARLLATEIELLNIQDAMERGGLGAGDPAKDPKAKPKRGRGGGGGRRREEEMGPPREAFELQERFYAEERAFAEQNKEFDAQMRQEMLDKRLESMAQLSEALQSATVTSMEAASMLGEAWGGAGAAVANASQIIVSEIGRVNALLEASTKATGGTADGWKKAAPGMLAASGKMTAGLIKDVQLQAAVMAIFEAAAAAASYPDVVGMASHGLASVLYLAVAGGAGGGASAGGGGASARGGRAGGRPTLDRGAQEPATPERAYVVTYNLNGVVTQEGAREIDRMARRDRSERFAGNPEWMPG